MLVSSLVDEANDAWRSYVREQDQVTGLSSTLNASAVSFTVDDPAQVSKGLLQIDDEMVQVRSVDRTTSTVTLEAWGRARMGSTAATHAIGAPITTAPLYPRVRVRDVISGVMQEIFPTLFPVASVSLTPNPAKINYALPADCYHVLSVSHNPPGPSLSWLPVNRWRQNKTPTAVELEILSGVFPGANRVRVFYARTPPAQLLMTDDLELMGYPVSIRDVIVLGAIARLAAFTETARVQAGPRTEVTSRLESVPAGSAMGLSRYLYQLFRQRLEDEGRNLQMRYPIVSHYTR